ncbi:intraflagellar transport protein 22 homolog [Caerostris extrusa]|uniref:Intraflagellar transport protein 22 homolog n=1 Tax=Caerostris extrusa TaxID=172846 RepID=A0AAV4VPQ9_CAEEX|nr:intraflagellar transport protein 22 homolog [Caerostris extrusa]
MYKVKLLVIGPCECGKSVISNFLADATETISNEYYPTQGVRILEFESDNLNIGGRIAKTEVELWDCSGDTKYFFFPSFFYFCDSYIVCVWFENCWPALMKDGNGVIFVYSSDFVNIRKEMDMWYANFVQAQGLKDSQCMVICHRKPNQPETRSSELYPHASVSLCVFLQPAFFPRALGVRGGGRRGRSKEGIQQLPAEVAERHQRAQGPGRAEHPQPALSTRLLSIWDYVIGVSTPVTEGYRKEEQSASILPIFYSSEATQCQWNWPSMQC